MVCLKLYLDTLDHKRLCLLCENSLLPLFRLFMSPLTSIFGGLNLYFDNFFVRKTVGSRETLRDELFFATPCITGQAVEQIDLVTST